jgi:hypothetical protein
MSVHHTNEMSSLDGVYSGEPFQVRIVMENTGAFTKIFAIVVQVVDEKGVVSALFVQEVVEVPIYRIATATTEESIIIDKIGVHMLKVIVIDDIESPSAIAYSERLLNVYDPEQPRLEKGTGHSFDIRIVANGQLNSHQLPPVDESANPPLYFEVRGIGDCSHYGDYHIRHDPFAPPLPEVDFSHGLRDPDLSNYINRVQNVLITVSEEVIVVEGSVVTLYDAPASGIFNLRFARFISVIYPEEPIDCFSMKSQYSANTASVFQADFTHDVQADYAGTPMIDELEYWVTGYQSDPESNVAAQYRFNFDIRVELQ